MEQAQYHKGYMYQRIVKAKLYIDNNFASHIDLHNIADEACFSKFHFIRLFTKAFGSTPHQYLTRKRVAKAEELLSAGKTMSETCFEVGFDSISSFSMLFKRITGHTPSAFQLMQQRKQAEIQHAPLKFIPNCFAAAHGWVK